MTHSKERFTDTGRTGDQISGLSEADEAAVVAMITESSEGPHYVMSEASQIAAAAEIASHPEAADEGDWQGISMPH